MVQWLKLPAWKVGDRGFKPHSDLQVLNEQNVSSPLTREDAILWGASLTVLGLRPPGLKFRLLFLKGSVIALISPSSRGSLYPV